MGGGVMGGGGIGDRGMRGYGRGEGVYGEDERVGERDTVPMMYSRLGNFCLKISTCKISG